MYRSVKSKQWRNTNNTALPLLACLPACLPGCLARLGPAQQATAARRAARPGPQKLLYSLGCSSQRRHSVRQRLDDGPPDTRAQVVGVARAGRLQTRATRSDPSLELLQAASRREPWVTWVRDSIGTGCTEASNRGVRQHAAQACVQAVGWPTLRAYGACWRLYRWKSLTISW